MEKFISSEVVDALQRILIIICIALPPWLSFIKYFRGKLNEIIILMVFIVFGYSTYKLGEVPPFILVLFILFFIYRRDDKDQLYYLRPLEKKKWEVLLQSIGFKFIITIVNMWFYFVLTGFGVTPVPQEISKVFMKSSWSVVIILSLLTVIVAPILEEFVFRHTLYRQLSKRIGRVGACLLTSALFALLHFNFLGTISFVGVGIYNCYLYDKYGYRGAVLNHFVFNFISTILIIAIKAFNG